MCDREEERTRSKEESKGSDHFQVIGIEGVVLHVRWCFPWPDSRLPDCHCLSHHTLSIRRRCSNVCSSLSDLVVAYRRKSYLGEGWEAVVAGRWAFSY